MQFAAVNFRFMRFAWLDKNQFISQRADDERTLLLIDQGGGDAGRMGLGFHRLRNALADFSKIAGPA